ncbi:unnamed protein product [Parnassius mnemosyne]|uniref:Uncharacterized protein n=1 Tax=Parnassius mnemosyne TaxID=213953 RepID=A0AAV1KH97_9NEOP
MASRSRKIMELINLQLVSPADLSTNEDEVPIQGRPSDHNKMSMDLGQDSAANVVILSDITNNPENKSYLNVKTFFESDEIAHQKCASRKRDNVNYNVSPLNSDESDVDVSDQDPTYDHQIKKKKLIPVYPVLRRLSSSSSSSSSSSGSSSSSSSESLSPSVNSNHEPENFIPTYQDFNTFNNPDTTANEQSIEAQGTSSIEEMAVGQSNIEEDMEIPKKKGRKRTSIPKNWRQNINRVLRNTGHSYVSKEKKIIPPREVKQPCTDRCRLKCSEKFTSVQR